MSGLRWLLLKRIRQECLQRGYDRGGGNGFYEKFFHTQRQRFGASI
jgi:hypothetical protein